MAKVFSKKDLARLIWPLIIEQVLAVLVGLIDTVMVSAVGDAAMSGVSLVDMINVLLINAMTALATGGAVVAAQLIGARRQEEACRSADQLMVVILAIALLLMGLALVLRAQILRLLFGAIDDEVMKNADTYFMITALSFPFLAIYNASVALFRAMGKSQVSMWTSLFMNGINVAGNAICIYGLKMGVEGVAVPTVISRAFAAILMLVLISHKKHEVHLVRGGFTPNLPMVRRILHIGVPSGVENSLFQLGRVLVVGIISNFGRIQIAANAIANNIDAMGCIPGQAIGLAMITVVGQCVGAGDLKAARDYTRKLLLLTYVVMGSFNILLLTFLQPILNAYRNITPDTRALATILIFIHNGCAILLWPSAFTLTNALRAANDVKFTMRVAVGSMAVFRIVFGYVLGIGFGLGAIGVWIAMVIDWVCRVAVFLWRFLSGQWLKYAKVPEKIRM